MRRVVQAVILSFAVGLGSASAQQGPSGAAVEPFKIGVLGDMSGIYADVSGRGAVEAVRMAVEDFGGTVLGRPVEVISADHQNKPDVAAAIARQWFDVEKVDTIADIVGSASSLAVIKVGTERKRVVLATNGATAEINGAQCSPYVMQYRSDTYAEAKSTAEGLLSQGRDTWYIIGADYSFGRTIARDITDVVTKGGGRVLGEVYHPLGTTDYSSYILAAQSSGAKVIAFANAGNDMVNSLKTASEFGLSVSGRQSVTGLLVFITDIHAVGLKDTQGLVLEDDFYWDLDDRARAFGERFFKRVGKMPAMVQAADYSATMNYLKAVQAVGTDDADAVMAYLRRTPIDDFYARNAYLRPDGLLIHDLYLMQVKTPAESKGPWDLYKLVRVIAGKDAFRPLDQSSCPLVKKG